MKIGQTTNEASDVGPEKSDEKLPFDLGWFIIGLGIASILFAIAFTIGSVGYRICRPSVCPRCGGTFLEQMLPLDKLAR